VVRFSGTVRDAQGTARTGSTTLTFAIYADGEGGSPLWLETQTTTLDRDGRYQVLLGATQPNGLPLALFASGDARWLGVRAGEEPEQTRVLLVSVPYALKAADAETIAGKPLSAFVLAGDKTGTGPDGLTYVDARVLKNGLSGAPAPPEGAGSPGYLGMFQDATTLVNSVVFQNGTGIGVGTTAPAAAFHGVGTAAPAALFDVYSNALGALPVVFRAARGTPLAPTAVQTDDILGGLAVRGYGTNTFSAGQGQVMFKAAENWTNAAHGTYLQFTTTPVGGSAWVERMRIDPAGNVGIGTTTPTSKLHVVTTAGVPFPGTLTDLSVFPAAVAGVAAPVTGVSIGVLGQAGTSTGVGVVGWSASADMPAMIAWNGAASGSGTGLWATSSSADGRAIEAESMATTGNSTAIAATSNSPAGPTVMIRNLGGGTVLSGTSGSPGTEVFSFAPTGIWLGADTIVGNNGTLSVAGNATLNRDAGVNGSLTVGDFSNLLGNVSVGGGIGFGQVLIVHGSEGVGCNLSVGGDLTKASGSFKIDHPLDPGNKYLRHSFVESPDMLNVYSGIAVLDRRGQAIVELPAYFEALNTDVRYQLTPIGAPAPRLHVAQKVSGNRFKIAGGAPGMEVSWQVTGVRQDAWAKAHPIRPEEDKVGAEKGTYLHPELFGSSAPAAAKK
jgi:hypothetical protein